MSHSQLALSRRSFMAGTLGGAAAVPLGITATDSRASQVQDDRAEKIAELPEAFPSQDPTLVRQVVGKSHSDLDGVRKLVEARPSLAKASYDWGFGDWETALGAASHVGRRDIAELLLVHGARPDLFTFTMFGQLDAVRATIAANPGVQRIPGPHGITLLAHARAGGEQAAAVVDYLVSLGDADPRPTNLPLDSETQASILGEYRFTGADASCHIIEQNNGTLAFRHGLNGAARPLMHQGNGTFHPAGAPNVRITAEAGRLMIVDGDLTLVATHA